MKHIRGRLYAEDLLYIGLALCMYYAASHSLSHIGIHLY